MVSRLQKLVAVADMGCVETEEDGFDQKVCGGRGECGPNNSCICEIRFTGDNCNDFNKSYHAGNSSAIVAHNRRIN